MRLEQEDVEDAPIRLEDEEGRRGLRGVEGVGDDVSEHGRIPTHVGIRDPEQRGLAQPYGEGLMMSRKVLTVMLLATLAGGATLRGAELSVGNVNMLAGDTASVIVSGDIAAESTFGVTIMVEIMTRVGNAGTVEFTSAPPVDIVQMGDPWPGLGTFSPFDTDPAGTNSPNLNGSVDDSGIGPGVLTFSGTLAAFPVVASADAEGIWDVTLSTSLGNGSWEGLPTTLIGGTITATTAECQVDLDCSDGVYCNGAEVCAAGLCVVGADPCPGQLCDETLDLCVDCLTDNDCNDGTFCNGAEPCIAGSCGTGSDPCPGQFCDEVANQCADCLGDPDCADGLYCNGAEVCFGGSCQAGTDPCPGQACDEPSDTCISCTTNADCDDGNVCTDDVCNVGACDRTNNTASCDDGLFCTLTDVCSGGVCVGSGDPCPGQACDDVTDSCLGSVAELSVGHLDLAHGGSAAVVVSGRIANFDTYGVNILLELIPRAGGTGTVTFTVAPPVDIIQEGDPWPSLGTFTAFDTDSTPSLLLNGSLDDNGTFIPGPTVFEGPLASFPVTASSGAGGIWDVVLSTSSGDSGWEGIATILFDGTITVAPAVGLSIDSFAMPPDAIADVVVSGNVESQSTFGVTILLELVPQFGAVGTLTFTPAPPLDIYQIGDPWPGAGLFSPFDTDPAGTNSLLLNGSVDDSGAPPGPLNFSGDLVVFPVVASPGADGQWDVMLATSSGDSYWENLSTVLVGGVITVTPGACLIDIDCDDADSCTADVCNAGVCEYTVVIGACDDGDLCTENDTCTGAVCAGTPIDCSGLDNSCNVGVCNDTNGVCEPAPANEGGTCDDGDPCTDPDLCVTGVCTGTFITGCINCILDTDCDDQNECTSDACPNGACDFAPVLGFCDDGDECTTNDRCVAGICTAGGQRNCDDSNLCTDDSCDTLLGCQNIGNSNPCDDGNPCTENDACGSGTCAGAPIPGCELCFIDTQCDDDNVCTDNDCVGGACAYPDNTLPCDDSDHCTVGDVCSGGACAGVAVDCSAFDDACNVGTCQPGSGLCFAIPGNEGGTCDDGLPCTVNDVCTNGVCEGTLGSAPAVDLTWLPSTQTVQSGLVFQVDLVATSGTCADQPVVAIEAVLIWDPSILELVGKSDPGPPWVDSSFPDDSDLDGLNAPFAGLPASDGDMFYQALGAFPSGAPVPPGGIVVTTFEFRALDGTPGTQVTIPATFGTFSQTRILGAGSDLGVDVTGSLGFADVQIVECQSAGDCDDGNVCTTEACNAGICGHTSNTLPCEDGLFCSTGDVCGGGVCVGGGDPCLAPLFCSESLDDCVECLDNTNCDDANVCTDNVCNVIGGCEYPVNTLPCDDGLFCTAIDVCNGGACGGSGDACPGAVCDEANDQCVECLADGDCDDQNVCTDDVCTGNVCQHSSNTAPCDDGQFCTSNDICNGGACVGGSSPCVPPLSVCDEVRNRCVQCLNAQQHCDDGNVCTTDVCNIANLCENPNNTLACTDDAVYCNGPGICSGGACVSTGDPCPGQLCDEGNERCVECFTPADCPGDGVGCTDDECSDGVCLYTPNDVTCDDGLFCNGPEFCHATLDCQGSQNPCDDPALCNETNDSCGCRQPLVAADGSRYLAVTPQPGETPVALLLTGVDLSVSCLSLYIQPDGSFGATPAYLPPRGPGGWETVHVGGPEIIPSVTYQVQTECDTGQGIDLSTSASVMTSVWADVNGSGFPVDFQDISLVVDGFRGLFDTTTIYSVDLWGSDAAPCSPQLIIDFVDIMAAVEAFRQAPFPCDDPCP